MNDTYRSQFRLPFDLADKLREACEAAGRSLNAEVVARLQASFEPPAATPGSFAAEMEQVLQELRSLTEVNKQLVKLNTLPLDALDGSTDISASDDPPT